MPTDIGAVSARERKAEAQTQTLITTVLVCFIIFLGMLVLLITDQSFSKTAIELWGRF
jgi:hypothetical protein